MPLSWTDGCEGNTDHRASSSSSSSSLLWSHGCLLQLQVIFSFATSSISFLSAAANLESGSWGWGSRSQWKQSLGNRQEDTLDTSSVHHREEIIFTSPPTSKKLLASLQTLKTRSKTTNSAQRGWQGPLQNKSRKKDTKQMNTCHRAWWTLGSFTSLQTCWTLKRRNKHRM